MDNLKEIAELVHFASLRIDQIKAKMPHSGNDAQDRAIRNDAEFVLRAIAVKLTNLSSDIRLIADHVATSTPIDFERFDA